ncbi:unnamed protein product [Tuber aestivum]|uniref:Uncharacterized protein n=1 Tax=Tuber aestivum TaxID=59557 RepID=A0A292Q159_9PEZI|nr:unnamed protein product [Tuber aestivum]
MTVNASHTTHNHHYHFYNGAVIQSTPGGSNTASNQATQAQFFVMKIPEGTKAAKAIEAPKEKEAQKVKTPDCSWMFDKDSLYYVAPASSSTTAASPATSANKGPAKMNMAGFWDPRLWGKCAKAPGVASVRVVLFGLLYSGLQVSFFFVY